MARRNVQASSIVLIGDGGKANIEDILREKELRKNSFFSKHPWFSKIIWILLAIIVIGLILFFILTSG